MSKIDNQSMQCADRLKAPPLICALKSIRSKPCTMSLSQRLRRVQGPPVNIEMPSLSHLTLEDLSQEIVTFGQKYMGCHFRDTWEDQEWVQFMVSRYGKSPKESHRRYLRYVELKVEALEESQETIPLRSNPQGVLRSHAKAKAMARHIGTPINTSLPDGEADWDIAPEMYASQTIADQNIYTTEDMEAIQQRMLNMENALSRVIRHIEDQAMMSQLSRGPEDQ